MLLTSFEMLGDAIRDGEVIQLKLIDPGLGKWSDLLNMETIPYGQVGCMIENRQLRTKPKTTYFRAVREIATGKAILKESEEPFLSLGFIGVDYTYLFDHDMEGCE